MINRNLKDGNQVGWNAGGIGYNQTDKCRNPDLYLSTNKDDIFTLALPYFPSPGSETIIDEAGYYTGYFCVWPVHYSPPTNWEVISITKLDGLGGHGCCSSCVVSYIELQYIGIDSDEPTEKQTDIIIIASILGLGLLLLLSKK